ncbi:cyclase family protein [Microaceticoccus formicicus]|uniref:cyclase family protein n=1 Tax=Microaceticoccus formicicus TaxID=3118105 RepID=UPI003CD03E82|nr:cyclase family protein [Peptoniphilaceae bacterium AMB_02]
MKFNKKYKLIDLTQEIYQEMPSDIGSQKTFIMINQTHKQNMKVTGSTTLGFSARNLLISERVATHSIAPSAFDSKGQSIDNMSLKNFYGSGMCINVSHKRHPNLIEVEDVKNSLLNHRLELIKGDILLLYTGHYNRTYPVYGYSGLKAKHTGLSYECAEYLAANGIVNIGIDSPSIDVFPNNTEESAYLVFAKYNITFTLNLCNLNELQGSRFLYFGLPLKIRNGTGSPVRAVALTDKNYY